ncbi:MAG: tyrosine-type recombinase/integrase [Nitrospirota bacterium]|nr:tyrosine-type recombinase/integrase [Nitrospirota bacterium]
MRGHLFQRYPGSWTIVLDVGRIVDPLTGRTKRVQKWKTIRGTKKEAQAELATMLHNLNRGQVISPSKMTLAEWLVEWLNSAIKPHKRIRTYETYLSVITQRLTPALGHYRLSDLRASHIQAYYQSSTLAPATLQQHQAILHHALKSAVMQDLIPRNAASLVIGKPRQREGHDTLTQNCWEAEEAKRFLDTAKAGTIQQAAFYSLAIDAGARKAELCGLKWPDLDVDKRTLSLVRQLVKVGTVGQLPLFGPPKNGKSRMIDLDERTIELLRRHKAQQSAQRLLLGTSYQDHGLIFARDFGRPLTMNNLGEREFARLVESAKVRRITFHGLRHTCATLLLQAGVPVKVVSERLGHKRIEITLNVYAHALPSMQQEAAVKLGRLLHG